MILFTSSSDVVSRSEAMSVGRTEHAEQRKRGFLRRIRRLGWGLLAAAVLLGGLEYYVFRNPYTYDLGRAAQGGFIGQWAHIDRAFAEVPDPAKIEYAVFGDSQSIDGLRPDLIADQLGVPPERVFNFSTVGGKPTDNAYTYRTYIGRMPNLRRVIYVVNEHQFNNVDAHADVKFKFHATLRQRLEAMDTDSYGELLTGWALRSFGLRTEWTRLVSRWRDGTWPAEPFSYPGGIRPQVWADPKTKSEEYAQEVADRWFRDWQPDGVYTSAFARLLADMTARGIDVAVLQIPRTDWYERIVARSYAAEQQQYLDRVRQAAADAGATFTIIAAADAGLTLEDFRDANHVNPSGADKLSRYAADIWRGFQAKKDLSPMH